MTKDKPHGKQDDQDRDDDLSPLTKFLKAQEDLFSKVYESPGMRLLQKQNNILAKFFDPPSMHALNEQNKFLQKLSNDPLMRDLQQRENAFKVLDEQNENLKNLLVDSPLMRDMKRMEDTFKGLNKQNEIFGLLTESPLVREMKKLDLYAKLVESPVLRALKEPLDSLSTLAESIAKVGIKDYHSMLPKLTENINQEFTRLTGSVRIQELEETQGALSRLAKTLPIKEHHATLSKIFGGQGWPSISDSLSIAAVGATYPGFVLKLPDDVREFFSKLVKGEFEDWVDPEPTNGDVIANEIDHFTQEVQQNKGTKLIDRFIERYEAQSPIVKFLISFFFIPFIVNQLSDLLSISDVISKENGNKAAIIRQVKSDIQPQNEFEELAFSQLRLVRTIELIVRSHASTKGHIHGVVLLGQRVKLLEKQKDWARIRYFDSDQQVYMEGWVFARYLIPIM